MVRYTLAFRRAPAKAHSSGVTDVDRPDGRLAAATSHLRIAPDDVESSHGSSQFTAATQSNPSTTTDAMSIRARQFIPSRFISPGLRPSLPHRCITWTRGARITGLITIHI
jgi:hypothetical protein